MPKPEEAKRLTLASNRCKTMLKLRASIGLLLVALIPFIFFGTPTANAVAANNTINFQARLEQASGAIASDGSYNVEFNLYTASSGGSSLWTEDYLVSAAHGIAVHNGYLSTSLGSLTSFPSTINWNEQLYLGMTVRGTTSCSPFSSCTPADAEMSPRMLLTSVPNAFTANQLATVNTGTGFNSTLAIIQPTIGNQTFQINDQAAAGTYTICVQGAVNANGGCAPTTGGIGYIQNQSASAQTTANFWISGTGQAATLQGNTSVLTPYIDSISGALTIGTTTATAVTIGNTTNTATVSIIANTTINDGNNANNKTINIGVTGATANTTAINIATSTGAIQTIKLGGTGLTSGSNAGTIVTAEGGQTNLSVANAGVTLQTFTNSTTAFQIQNSNATNILSVDTTANAENLYGNLNLNQVSGPGSAPTVAVHAIAGVLNSTYYYVYSYVTASGISNYSSMSAGVTPASQQVNVTVTASANPLVTGINIYRSKIGTTAQFYLVNGGPLSNTTQTYSDNIADGSLGAAGSVINYSSSLQLNGANILTADTNFNTANTGLGSGALQANTSGVYNTAVGLWALHGDTSGIGNSGLGYLSLANNTTGSDNTGLGYYSLGFNTTGGRNTAVGYYAGEQDSGNNFKTLATIQNATAIGAYAQVQVTDGLVLGSVDTPTLVGIGTTVPLNTFSVSPLDYNTGTACSVASMGSSVCAAGAFLFGTGTTWTSAMVGDEVIFADGQEALVVANGSTGATALALSGSINEATGSYYRLHHIGLQVTSAGQVGIGNVSPAYALDVLGSINASTSLRAGTASATGSLVLQNGSGGYAVTLQTSTSQSNSVTLTIPANTGSSDTFCLVTKANCGGGSGVTTVNTLDGGTANANGAYISGTSIYLQSASVTYPGLVNNTAQSFSGNKTFNGNINLNQVAAPGSAPTVALGAAGVLNSTYYYVYSYVTATGITTYSSPSSSITPASQQVNVTVTASGNALVTGIKIYRTKVGATSSGPFFLDLTEPNTSGTYPDNVVDGSLGVAGSELNYTATYQINGAPVLIADYSANTALGVGSLQVNSSAIGNTSIGYLTLSVDTTGGDNTALGAQALLSNIAGTNSTAIGAFALQNNTAGYNTAVGDAASLNNTSGTYNTSLGYHAGYADSGANFKTLATIQNATAIGAYSQVQVTDGLVLGSVDTPTLVGIGTTVPLNTFSVSPLDYNTGTACSVASMGSSVCAAGAFLFGTGTTWTSAMVGDEVIFADGQEALVIANGSTGATALALSGSINEPTGSYYRLHHIGLQVTSAGQVGIGNVSPSYALDVIGIINTSSTLQAGTSGAAGSLILQDGSGGYTISLSNTLSQGNNIALTIPVDTHTTDTLCLVSLANCSGGSSSRTEKIILVPEFTNAVLDSASDASCSSANTGTMTSGLYNSGTTFTNFYKWAGGHGTTQCYDVVVRIPIPAGWTAWTAAPTISGYSSDGTAAMNVDVRDTTGTLDGSAYQAVTGLGTATWNTVSLGTLSGTYAANGVMTMRIRMSATTSDYIELGTITLSYTNTY